VADLEFGERPADGEPQGLLVLSHGRGTDELDLLGLADLLDSARRLEVIAPRGPLQLPGSPGYHWYVTQRVGYPEPHSFEESRRKLAQLHDELWERFGIGPERTVLGGFSMGAVMSYALGLSGERPAPAGILAFSGFIPTAEGWEPSLEDRQRLRAFIAHGRQDPVIDVAFGQRARDLLVDGGLDVSYHEHEGAHHIDPRQFELAARWLADTLKV
jgi:phospholipase/carboxylesterase